MNRGRDDIEKLILDNLDGLNNQEPKEGHFERFEEKLNQRRKGRKTLRIAWRVVAAAVFLLLAVNQALIYLAPAQEDEAVTLGSISREYEEVEFYYTSSIEEGLTRWEQFEKAGLLTEEDKRMMDNELKEFENVLKGLQHELKANPNDERVINAMLMYYQNKLNVINLIINKLQEVKETMNQKENKYENEI